MEQEANCFGTFVCCDFAAVVKRLRQVHFACQDKVAKFSFPSIEHQLNHHSQKNKQKLANRFLPKQGKGSLSFLGGFDRQRSPWEDAPRPENGAITSSRHWLLTF
jgi:hypothetical protein